MTNVRMGSAAEKQAGEAAVLRLCVTRKFRNVNRQPRRDDQVLVPGRRYLAGAGASMNASRSAIC
jgi:hypothetical protein